MTAPVRTGFIAYSEVNNRTFKNNLPNNDDTRFSTFTLTTYPHGDGVPEYFHFVQIVGKRSGVIYIKPLVQENLGDPIIQETNCLAFIHCKKNSRVLYCQDSLLNQFAGTSFIAVNSPTDQKAHFFSIIGSGNNDGIKISAKTQDYVFKLFDHTAANAIAHAKART